MKFVLITPTQFLAQTRIKTIARRDKQPRHCWVAAHAHDVAALQSDADLSVYGEHRLQFAGRDFVAFPLG